jgi:hypothetical protein
MKKEFSGYLSAFTPAIKDNVPFVKFSIKTSESGAGKHLLDGTQDLDNAFSSVKDFVTNKGYGNTKCDLDDPLRVNVTFASFSYEAFLVSIAVKKKVDKELGDVAEYTFNFEKDPKNDDTQFWSSHLKVKETDDGDEQDDEDGVSPVDAEIMAQTDSMLGLDEAPKKKKKKSGFIMYAVTVETPEVEEGTEDVPSEDA